ncbi:MAG TPA: peptide ABC transporter substrate-binding protein [Clostridiales bacterium]|nr:peptide ABC transporter substrate-binding protein [Clostridiales bacterium]
MNRINKRKVSTCVLLTLFTFGIYGIYWMYLLVNSTHRILNKNDSCTKEMLCLIFVPFYFLYWWYTRGEILNKEAKKQNLNFNGSGVAYLLFSIFFLEIVSMAIMQGDFNSIEEKVEESEYLLTVRHLKKYFPTQTDFFGKPTQYVKAVDDVTFGVKSGCTVGIVGESGCGKTTMGRTILRLHSVTDGEVIFDGKDIGKMTNSELRKIRPQIQMIFQDPYSSLSPRLRVGEIIGEAVAEHGIVPKAELKDYVLGVMKKCGLQVQYYERYPHEFSGGQRQRICIARALALKPKLVICDEPVSALDVSIQAQIINLLKSLQKNDNLAYIFISHDLSVVEHISDEVGVMYLGSMVEYGAKKDIFSNPMHPYTQALFSAVPIPDPDVKNNRIILKGDIPSPANPPSGCKFHTRCSKCMEICKVKAPVFKEYSPGHRVACHLYEQNNTNENN